METETLTPNPTPLEPPSETTGPEPIPDGQPGDVPGVQSLEELGAAPQPETPGPVGEPKPRIPFSGKEIAAFVGLLGLGFARPRSLKETELFGAKFHGPMRLDMPAMGVEFTTTVAESLDSLRVGEALAAFGIYKPGGWGGDLGELPPVMRLALGLAVVGYAAYGGVRAVQEYRADNQAVGDGGGGGSRFAGADDAN